MRFQQGITAKTMLPTRDRVIRTLALTVSFILTVTLMTALMGRPLHSALSLTMQPPYALTGVGLMPVRQIANESRLLQMTHRNRHMVYLHGADILITTMAKAGSSTLWHWLYKGLTGQLRWDSSACEGHVHEKRDECWRGYASFLFSLPVDEQWRVLTANSTLRVAIQRDPFDRLLSAYKSKFTCEDTKFKTDVHERKSMVSGLRKGARQRRLGYPTSCMNITDFAQALDACRRHVGEPGYPARLSDLDDHIRPQDFYFDEIDYDMVIDVRHLSDLNILQPIINRLPHSELVKDGISHRHSSGSSLLNIPEDAAGLLYAFALESKPGKLKFLKGAEPMSTE